MKNIKATIIISTYNMANYVENAIFSVLSQSERNFELIVVNDGSEDNTSEILRSIKDNRMKLIFNKKNLGISKARNKAIKLAKSNYLFFTDADCVVSKNWLKTGLKHFDKNKYVALEGKIYYVSKKYRPTYSDRVVQNLFGGEYMTANMAYRKDIILKAGLFNPIYVRNEDRELALRVKKLGAIKFIPKFIVNHAISKWKPKKYFKSGKWVYYRTVLFLKNFNERYDIAFRIYAPKKLLTIIFPPLVLLKLLTDNYKTKDDYILFMLIYPRLVYERFILWKYCIREKVFLI